MTQQPGRIARARNYAGSHGVSKLFIVMLIVCIAIVAYFVYPPFTNIVNGIGATAYGLLANAVGAAAASTIVQTYVMGWPYFLLWAAPLFFIVGALIYRGYMRGVFWGHNKTMDITGMRKTTISGYETNAPHSEPQPPPRPVEQSES